MVFDDMSHKNPIKCEAKTVAAFEAEFNRMSFLGFLRAIANLLEIRIRYSYGGRTCVY